MVDSVYSVGSFAGLETSDGENGIWKIDNSSTTLAAMFPFPFLSPFSELKRELGVSFYSVGTRMFTEHRHYQNMEHENENVGHVLVPRLLKGTPHVHVPLVASLFSPGNLASDRVWQPEFPFLLRIPHHRQTTRKTKHAAQAQPGACVPAH